MEGRATAHAERFGVLVWRAALVDLFRSQWIGAAILAAIGLLGVVGSDALGAPHPRLDLDAEYSAGAVLSTALLAGGAFGAALLAWDEQGVGRRVAASALAATLAFMAADELLSIHEHLRGIGGSPWVLWYLPVPGLAILCGLMLARDMDARARLYLALGVLGWAVAAGIEAFLWGDGPRFQDPRSLPVEEMSEMLAALAIAAGLLRAADGRDASVQQVRQVGDGVDRRRWHDA